MADRIDKLGLDASQLLSSLANVETQLKTHGLTVEKLASSYVKGSEDTKALEVQFKAVTDSGKIVDGVIKNLTSTFDIYVKKITQATGAQREFNKAQRDQALKAGGEAASTFLGRQTAVPTQFQGQIQRVQQQLSKALASAGDTALPAANEIFAKLKGGIVDVETGIRGRIQTALIAWLQLQERIRESVAKTAGATVQQPNVSSNQLASLRTGLATNFPVPSGANLQSVIAYQAQLDKLIATVTKSKAPFEQLRATINSVIRNPTAAFSGTDQGLANVHAQTQRLVASFGTMQKSIQQTEQVGRQASHGLLIGFDQFLRVLQIQIVHRVFGNLITGMQGAIGAAAQLQVSISEIRTISQGTGISFEFLQQRIRSLSEEFNRPQADVAAALYEGFSNQVIKTASDLSLMNEVLRLARISVSSTADSMNLLSSSLNSYGFATIEASRLTDQLFRAIDLGRFTATDIANTLGRATVVASQVGVKYEEVLGLLANVTRAGVTPAEGLTQISAIMQSLIRPSDQMKELFREWGVDSGFAAVQTFGFVDVLRRLFDESKRGGDVLGAAIPNVRAFRLALGATRGGGVGSLEQDISEITNAGDRAERATGIITESAGERFRTELTKIQNFFINDFANGFIEGVEKISQPFGGLSNLLKQIGTIIIDLTGLVGTFLQVLTNVVTVGGLIEVNIGTLIKVYLAYRLALIGTATAQTVLTKVTQIGAIANLQIASGFGVKALSVDVVTARLARYTGVIGTYSLTSRVATVATNLFSAALKALPFVAIVALIGFLTGAFDGWLSGLSSTNNEIDRMKQFTDDLTKSLERAAVARDRVAQVNLRDFRADLEARSQATNRVFAHLQRQADALLSSQQTIVARTTERLKDAAGAISSVMSKTISDIKKGITDAENAIRESFRRQLSFGDRDSSSRFTAAFQNASRVPEVVSGLQPLQRDQLRIQDIQRRGEASAFQQQQFLLQRRLTELQSDAQRLTALGDRESMESARRKFEEIRRLTNQLFELDTERGRAITLQRAEDAARASGGIVEATFAVNLDRLNAMLDEIRRQEEAAEIAFRARQERERTRLAANQAAAEGQQRRLQQALQNLTTFTGTTAQGAVRPEFQGPRGLEEFRRQFDALQTAARTAASEAGIPVATIETFILQAGQQRIALEGQIQRQITVNEVSEVRRRFQLAQEEVSRLRTEGEAARAAGQRVIDTNLATVQTRLTSMFQEIVAATPNAIYGTFFSPLYHVLSDVQTRFLAAQRLTERRTTEFNAARGTEREAEAFRALQESIAAVNSTYRDYLRAFGDNQVPGRGGRTGNQLLAAGTSDATTNTAVTAIATARTSIAEANTNLATAQTRLNEIEVQLRRLGPDLGLVAIGFGQAGRVAADINAPFTNLAATIERLATAIERLRGVGIPAVPGPGGPPLPGFASGGLIGSGFSVSGPDNTLIRAKLGEFVVNPDSTRRFYSELVAINSNKVRGYAEGGLVQNTNIGDVNMHVDGSRTPEVTARAVIRRVKREGRRGNGRI